MNETQTQEKRAPGGTSARLCSTLQDARQTSPVVEHVLRAGGTLEDAVCALVNGQTALTNRLIELEGLAPRKIKMPDGRVLIWRCPEELVPLIEDLSNSLLDRSRLSNTEKGVE